MSKPLIQIDDLIREMTDEEHAQYLEDQNNATPLPTPDSSADAG